MSRSQESHVSSQGSEFLLIDGAFHARFYEHFWPDASAIVLHSHCTLRLPALHNALPYYVFLDVSHATPR